MLRVRREQAQNCGEPGCEKTLNITGWQLLKTMEAFDDIGPDHVDRGRSGAR